MCNSGRLPEGRRDCEAGTNVFGVIAWNWRPMCPSNIDPVNAVSWSGATRVVPEVSGPVRRDHHSHFPPPQLLSRRLNSRRPAGLAWSPIVLTQANAVPTIALVSAIIRHCGGETSLWARQSEWYVHPPGHFLTCDKG